MYVNFLLNNYNHNLTVFISIMSTTCTKFIPSSKKIERAEYVAEPPKRYVNESIKESSINIGTGELLPENVQTLNQLNFPFHEGDANKNRIQQKLQKERSSDLRQHSFKFGYDKRDIHSLNQQDFHSFDKDVYVQNMKDIIGIGKSAKQNNWFRSTNDLQDWKQNQLKSEFQREFIPKPVTNPEIISQQRKELKIANTSQHFKYGYSSEPPLKSSYQEMCSTNKSIDPKERSYNKTLIAEQKKVLSQSSYVHGNPKTDSLRDAKSAYSSSIGGQTLTNEEILENKKAVKEMKQKILKASINLGSDTISYTSEYKNLYPNFKFASS